MLPHFKLISAAGIVLLVALGAPAAAGTLFKWVAEDGSVAFTDDPERIPERYRSQVEKIDVQLQALDERSAMIDVMAQTFGGVMANMTEQDIAAYVDGTVLNGEFSTLQAIPEIADALAQAQQAQEAQIGQTTLP